MARKVMLRMTKGPMEGRTWAFTEHDTFRSNQIREGVLSREDALVLVAEENRPRYPNIKWYLDAIGMDFAEVISVVNAMPRPTPRASLTVS